MTAEALLFTLSCIGISETAYLIKKRKRRERVTCVLGESCNAVLNSAYSRIFLLPNDVLGLLFYTIIAAVAALSVLEVSPQAVIKTLSHLLILSSTAVSIFLTFIQWKVLKAWCFWCVMSTITIFLMALIVITELI
jgi:uncharacterized membrane protein